MIALFLSGAMFNFLSPIQIDSSEKYSSTISLEDSNERVLLSKEYKEQLKEEIKLEIKDALKIELKEELKKELIPILESKDVEDNSGEAVVAIKTDEDNKKEVEDIPQEDNAASVDNEKDSDDSTYKAATACDNVKSNEGSVDTGSSDNESTDDTEITASTSALLNTSESEPESEEAASTDEKYHYYLYTASYCSHCVPQLTELENHTDSSNIDVIENEGVTKSGEKIKKYPTLEIYKDDKCIYHGEGYKSWNALVEAIKDEIR